MSGRWAPLFAAAPALDLPDRRTVVVVPHPDDEALSTSALIMRQVEGAVPVVVVAVTDGEAAYADWPAPELGRLRRREQAEALEILGVPTASIVRLGVPDGAVAQRESAVADALAALLEPGDLLVAPWTHDWHPDHEACGRAALRAATTRGAPLLGALFWAYRHVDPAVHPPLGLATLHLNEAEVQRRTAALQAHRSQLGPIDRDPILTVDVLDHLSSAVEHFVVTG